MIIELPNKPKLVKEHKKLGVQLAFPSKEIVLDYIYGDFLCNACNHLYRDDYHIHGSCIWYLCPNCNKFFSQLHGQIILGDPHWSCICGYALFSISKTDGIYCPKCGTAQNW